METRLLRARAAANATPETERRTNEQVCGILSRKANTLRKQGVQVMREVPRTTSVRGPHQGLRKRRSLKEKPTIPRSRFIERRRRDTKETTSREIKDLTVK